MNSTTLFDLAEYNFWGKICTDCCFLHTDDDHAFFLASEMSLHHNATLTLVDEDPSSGSGEETNVVDGHNKQRQSALPSSSGRQKRSRKATGDAIVDAMLEIAAASKMRAAAIMKNEDRFSISKCIKVLDDMQGVDQHLYFLALDLFENPNARETFIALKSERRLMWLQGKCKTPFNSVI